MDRFSEHDPVDTYFERQQARNAYEDDRWKERVEDEMVREAHDKNETKTEND
jgi:hypothetical protein